MQSVNQVFFGFFLSFLLAIQSYLKSVGSHAIGNTNFIVLMADRKTRKPNESKANLK